MPPEKVNLGAILQAFDDHWSPKIIGELDGYDLKAVKLLGDFVWHKHEDADEFFLVVDGRLAIEFEDGRVDLEPGEFIVVPRGLEHKPVAEEECSVLLIERHGVVNTGDAPEGEYTRHQLERI